MAKKQSDVKVLLAVAVGEDGTAVQEVLYDPSKQQKQGVESLKGFDNAYELDSSQIVEIHHIELTIKLPKLPKVKTKKAKAKQVATVTRDEEDPSSGEQNND